MAGDIVYENFVTENLQIMHNPDQKWFYLPDQTTSEVLIFKSADSEHSDAPGESPYTIHPLGTDPSIYVRDAD